MLHQFIMYIQCLNTENIPVRSTIFAAVIKIWPIYYITVVNSVADPGDARSHLSLNFFNFIQFLTKMLPINRLAQFPLRFAPPLRNPGSATAFVMTNVTLHTFLYNCHSIMFYILLYFSAI